MFFIRNRRLALIVCFGFFNEEYLIAPVDFIVALRRTKGRRRWTLRSPSPPWNHACVVHWTPPPHPGEIRCGGAFWLPRLTGIQDSGIRCRFLIPTSIYRLGALCSALYRSRFSRVVGLGTFIFHYWGVDRSYLRLHMGWAIIFRWICADREWVGNMADEGGGKQNHNVHVPPIWYCILPLHRKLYPAIAPRRRRMLPQPLANDLLRERTEQY